MPAITISAVNTGTDTITATAHGLLTGDRFRLRNVGGALPAATPSLAAVTDYFAVRTGADTLKIATSSANALAGTPVVVDITGSGSGTSTVEYGLPYCIPNAIMAPGVQVPSTGLNGAWNSLVALYDLLTGQAESVWSGNVTLAGTLYAADLKHGSQTETVCATAGTALEAHWVNDPSTGAFKKSVGNGLLTVSIPVKVGDRITGLTFQLFGNGSADVTAVVEYIDATMSPVQVGSLTVNNEPAAWSTKTVTIASPHKMVAAESAHVTFLSSATGLQLGNINYTRDRPLP